MTAGQKCRAFTVAAACVVFLASCGSAAAAVQLELKLNKGRTYYQRLQVDQQITQNIMGQEQVIGNVIGVGQKLDVLDVDAQGNLRIQYTYTWSRFKQSGPMGIVDYDSAQVVTVPGGAEGFAALVGGSYTVRLSPKGDVLDVNGVKELAAAVSKHVPESMDISSEANPVAFLLSEDGIRETTEGLLSVYPDGPVDEGDSWGEKRLTKQGLAMVVESKWTLQKRQAGVATITSVSSMKSDPSGAPMDTQGMKMKIDVSGTQEDTTQVEEATGLIRHNRSHSLLKGQIGIGTSAEGPFDMMAIPVAFETTATVEMSDRKLDTGSK